MSEVIEIRSKEGNNNGVVNVSDSLRFQYYWKKEYTII